MTVSSVARTAGPGFPVRTGCWHPARRHHGDRVCFRSYRFDLFSIVLFYFTRRIVGREFRAKSGGSRPGLLRKTIRLYAAAAIHRYLIRLLLAISLFSVLHWHKKNTKERSYVFLTTRRQAFVTDGADWGEIVCGW